MLQQPGSPVGISAGVHQQCGPLYIDGARTAQVPVRRPQYSASRARGLFQKSGCGKMSRTPSLGRGQVSSNVSTPLPVQQDHEPSYFYECDRAQCLSHQGQALKVAKRP